MTDYRSPSKEGLGLSVVLGEHGRSKIFPGDNRSSSAEARRVFQCACHCRFYWIGTSRNGSARRVSFGRYRSCVSNLPFPSIRRVLPVRGLPCELGRWSMTGVERETTPRSRTIAYDLSSPGGDTLQVNFTDKRHSGATNDSPLNPLRRMETHALFPHAVLYLFQDCCA